MDEKLGAAQTQARNHGLLLMQLFARTTHMHTSRPWLLRECFRSKYLPKQSYSDCSERSAEKMTQMQRCGKSSISSISSRRPAVGMSSLQESNFPC